MITDLIDPELQVQQVGIDLSVKEMDIKPLKMGVNYLDKEIPTIDFDNSQRVIFDPDRSQLSRIPQDGLLLTGSGSYRVLTNENFKLPKDVLMVILSRTSLLRNGACIVPAVFDPGYAGPCTQLLNITSNLRVLPNFRFAQVLTFKVGEDEVAGLYEGQFKEVATSSSTKQTVEEQLEEEKQKARELLKGL
jgi:deoxycytidine triphosphate deaminase